MSRAALADFDRLAAFLALVSPGTEERMLATLRAVILNLGEYPEIGVHEYGDRRKLAVRFGRSGYEVRYRYNGTDVLVSRIRHMLEDR